MKIKSTTIELEVIVNRIRQDALDLQPNFQRGEIWDLKRKQRLIDTILRNWYIPAVHIVEEQGKKAEVVLDGQQRLATIRDYFDNKFRIDGHIEPEDPNIEKLHGKTYDELPAEVKWDIDRFDLPISKLYDYDPREPNELFFRLNQSYNLTPPEKRNALHGPARDQVKDLVKSLTAIGLLDRSKVGFSNGRLAHDDIVARSCVAMESNTIKTHINNSVVEEFYRTREFSTKTLERIAQSAEILLHLINQSDERIRFNKGTLQTWLIYCAWAPERTGTIPPNLLSRFEENRLQIRSGQHHPKGKNQVSLSRVLRQYDDRASYRVTDVSSVLIRDFAVHLYSHTEFGTPQILHSSDIIGELSNREDDSAAILSNYIKDSSWGERLFNE